MNIVKNLQKVSHCTAIEDILSTKPLIPTARYSWETRFLLWCTHTYIYDRLRSTSTPQIGVHWRHYLKSRSNFRIFSNRHPFQTLIHDESLPSKI